MTNTSAARGGRPRVNLPRTKRGRDLLAEICAKWGGVAGLSRETGLDRGTIERAIQSNDPSRLSSKTLDRLIGAGLRPTLLGRTG